jgi:molecular chaperone DnaJ
VPTRGGSPGDLYATVHVESHPDGLKREGDNIRSHFTISFVQAALGTTITVDTLEGKRDITIPAGTQPGTEFRLTGFGFPLLGSGIRGDHVVTVKVEVPKKLSRKQKQLLREFESSKQNKRFFGL